MCRILRKKKLTVLYLTPTITGQCATIFQTQTYTTIYSFLQLRKQLGREQREMPFDDFLFFFLVSFTANNTSALNRTDDTGLDFMATTNQFLCTKLRFKNVFCS